MTYSVRVVKELKGAALSIVMALGFAGGVPVNQAWLERNTGYTDKPVSQALAYLLEHGFVMRSGSGWLLAEGARQLPLPMEQMGDGDNSDTLGGSRKVSDSPISIIDASIIKEDISKPYNTNNESRNFSDFPELEMALKDAGIRENVRTRRLLGRIDAADVTRVVGDLRNNPMHTPKETGLLVTMLETVAEKNDRKGGYADWTAP